MKQIVFRRTEIKTPPLSTTARVRIGQLLRKLADGELLSLPQSRPMPSIEARVHELRVDEGHQTWRVFYRIDEDAIVVVDLLSKQTEQTPLPTIRRCQQRLRAYDEEVTLQRKNST